MSSFNELIKSKEPVLVDFHATWCRPCKAMAPILEDVKSDLGGKVRIIKVDVDRNLGAAQKYNVRGVPTLILFKEGQQIWRQSGVVPKAELLAVLSRS